jgi:hypothetical protein
MKAAAFALIALVPMIPGSPPAKADSLTVRICAGGEVRTREIPLPRRDPAPSGPCDSKGCHAGCGSRKRFDRRQ